MIEVDYMVPLLNEMLYKGMPLQLFDYCVL